MNAALNLADQGFETVLLEKEDRLGGLANRLSATIEGADIQKYISSLSDRVMTHSGIQVLTRSLVVGFSGYKGNFTTEVLVGPGMYERKIEHGAVVVATGAHEYRPKEYFYGEDSRVLTQIELATRISEQGAESILSRLSGLGEKGYGAYVVC
jgi:heterodisulfide reductase subunit A-like polyferredoxin